MMRKKPLFIFILQCSCRLDLILHPHAASLLEIASGYKEGEVSTVQHFLDLAVLAAIHSMPGEYEHDRENWFQFVCTCIVLFVACRHQEGQFEHVLLTTNRLGMQDYIVAFANMAFLMVL